MCDIIYTRDCIKREKPQLQSVPVTLEMWTLQIAYEEQLKVCNPCNFDPEKGFPVTDKSFETSDMPMSFKDPSSEDITTHLSPKREIHSYEMKQKADICSAGRN